MYDTISQWIRDDKYNIGTDLTNINFEALSFNKKIGITSNCDIDKILNYSYILSQPCESVNNELKISVFTDKDCSLIYKNQVKLANKLLEQTIKLVTQSLSVWFEIEGYEDSPLSLKKQNQIRLMAFHYERTLRGKEHLNEEHWNQALDDGTEIGYYQQEEIKM